MAEIQEARYSSHINSALVDKYQIGVRFLGNLDYLPADVRNIANKVSEQTKHNTR